MSNAASMKSKTANMTRAIRICLLLSDFRFLLKNQTTKEMTITDVNINDNMAQM